MRHFTDEELADAIRIDPSQIQGLGPSIDALIELLEQRKERILATYDPTPATHAAAKAFLDTAAGAVPDTGKPDVAKRIAHAIAGEQLRDLERCGTDFQRIHPSSARSRKHWNACARSMKLINSLHDGRSAVAKRLMCQAPLR
ncbi:MAG: hypothetical protein RI986_411 [Planctomycetota bacterium]